MTDARAVEQIVAQLAQQLGEVDPDVWWRCMDVNLRGPYLCSRAVLPGMIARGSGRIITTASHTGVGPWPGSGAYAISKTAVIRLCETMAAEVKDHGISVFSIHPGGVATAMTASQFGSEAARIWFPRIYKYVTQGVTGQPPELAGELVVFLASGKADALSGCFISVDDDVTEMVSRAEEIQANELHRLRLRT